MSTDLSCFWRNTAFSVALLFASVFGLTGQTYSVLVDFNGADGATPSATLVQGTDGNFYGTTLYGGNPTYCSFSFGCGSVFKATAAGTVTLLYAFCSQAGCPDGDLPNGALVQGTDGNLYGTTSAGGARGGGTVFKISPSGSLTTIYSFCSQTNCTDGFSPNGGLVQGSDGNFYGTTFAGGFEYYECGSTEGSCGTVFKISPSGALTTLYSFCYEQNCLNGDLPAAGLVLGSDGNFYGTAAYGGASGAGTVFKITPSGALTAIYNFCSLANCADGQEPLAPLTQGADGNLYGTTYYGGRPCNSHGCGTAFKITPAGALSTLYDFCSKSGCADGLQPLSSLFQGMDGNFYGTTYYGGLGTGYGTAFRITPAGALNGLHSFCSLQDCADGEYPTAGVIQATNGNFYGTASFGGTDSTSGLAGDGVVFEVEFCPTGPGSCAVTTVTSSATPSTYGSPVTLTALVQRFSGTGTPTGSVEFTDNGNFLATVNLSNGSAAFTTSALTAGTHSIVAAYSGDANFNPNSGTLQQVVNQVATTTTVSSSANPAVYFQALTFSAQVTPASGSGVPTGSVTFLNGSTTLGSAALSGGSATLKLSAPLAPGGYSITASYSGDANCLPGTSATLSQVVQQASTTLALKSSANPASVNQDVSFTATITPQVGGNPTGTVTFYDNGPAMGPPVAVSGGEAVITASFAAPGSYSITAVYSGNSDFAGSTAPGLNQTVRKYATASAVSSNLNPSTYGQSIKLTVKVSSSGPTPTGTVTFEDGGTKIATAALSGGTASLTTSKLPAGTNSITALYGGDADSLSSTSPVLSQVVDQAATTTIVGSSPNPSTAGETVTFTASVSSAYAVATGTVTFAVGSATLGTATLSGGIASLSTAKLPAGAEKVTASYGGSDDFVGSSGSVKQVVQ